MKRTFFLIGLSMFIVWFGVACGEDEGPSLPTIVYHGNGNTGGAVPVDGHGYTNAQTATVLGNVGSLVKINVSGISYRYDGWTNASGAIFTNGQTFSMGVSNVHLYCNWVPFSLRDTGYGGGLVFYIADDYSAGWRYMEAAPESTEWVQAHWGIDDIEDGAGASTLGSGWSNTTNIVSWLDANGLTNRAAQLCRALVHNGYSDWFLPALEELALVYTNLHAQGVGGFLDEEYWSSSEDWNYAYVVGFHDGSHGWYQKPNQATVRACRRF